MIDKKRYLFYPYSHKDYGLVKVLLLYSEDIDITAPYGTGLVNKDISYVVNRGELGKVVQAIEPIEYSNYDTLIISSHINLELCKDELLLIIDRCKKEKIEIVYLGKNEEIKTILREYELYISYDLEDINHIEKVTARYKELNLPIYIPKVPVVYVGGLIETIDSFDISLRLKLELEKLDYNVALITKEADGKLFGSHFYPDGFMGNNEFPENQIMLLNRLVQAIDYVEKPDIIIMDIPKGMMRYSDSFYNSFGIYTYMIAQTLPPDYFILTIPYIMADREYIDNINQYFKNLVGKNIDTINITNSIHDTGSDDDASDIPLYTSENNIEQIIFKNRDNDGINLTNLNQKENVNILINNIIERFS
ncbi:hypothetical protein KQI41_02010 [Tissierella pigra]|uniref:hypothetical protein n=1 Tax=Tissierella pigra TaxID=2607614 RepID=UPI001C0F9E17|nr:hypothetical protein [Tissierella pigra]MBU5425173.1 hypothetical protein [Tissierella pigra]